MREPRFWSRDVDPRSREAAPLLRFLLTPFAWGYAAATAWKIRHATPRNVDATVICVGNLTTGGVGKSPVVAALRRMLSEQGGKRVATLSRGYKGRLKGPIQVLPETHSAVDVGDEPLMLARSGESWIGADRAEAGAAMSAAGVDVILMDDGHQNPGLYKDFSIIVVDTQAGFGNEFVIPKGPLRETIAAGLSRADAIIIVGDGTPPADVQTTSIPCFRARITATDVPAPGPCVAFAGIGRPEKFFDTLTDLNVDVRDSIPFPDHHAFSKADQTYLKRLARDHGANLITTEKDYVRLDSDFQADVQYLGIEMQFDDRAALDNLLRDVIKPGKHEQT